MTARNTWTVLAIDPGSEQSAWVLWDGERVKGHGQQDNHALLMDLMCGKFVAPYVVFEEIASYGMPVGREVFETVYWTGRMVQAVLDTPNSTLPERMLRRAVKLHLCQSARAKDSNVRQALLDRFGGDKAARGKKAAPGPLYGLKADEWQALALAVTWMDLHGKPEDVARAVCGEG